MSNAFSNFMFRKNDSGPSATNTGHTPPIAAPSRIEPSRQVFNRNNYSKNNLRVIPLGGLEEVGRNMTVFEYGQDIIIVDMGLQFPDEDMPGIDYIIPDVSYLHGKEKNIRGVLITHGHY